jgi:hypothetical protein
VDCPSELIILTDTAPGIVIIIGSERGRIGEAVLVGPYYIVLRRRDAEFELVDIGAMNATSAL